MSVERLKKAVDIYEKKSKSLDKQNVLGSYLSDLKSSFQGKFGSEAPKSFYDKDAALGGENYSQTIRESYGNMGLNMALSSGIAGHLFQAHVDADKRKDILKPVNGALIFNFLNGKKESGDTSLYEGQYRNFYIKISMSNRLLGFGGKCSLHKCLHKWKSFK